MAQIIEMLQNGLAYLIPMTVLLGLLIFIHELGHFLVAKYYKVRVEVFSLGFGPKILKYKRGDTVYAISAIPLGGYVKMFGDDPTAEVDSSQKAYAFNAKPVGQRIAVVLAGPLMNFFFAIVLFSAVSSLGEKALAPKLGDIEAKSVAYADGFRSGDTIVAVAGEPAKSWDEFLRSIEKSPDTQLPITVARADGQKETLNVTPKYVSNKNVLSWDRHVGEVEGLTYASLSTVIGVRHADSIAGRAGIKTGDMIQSINGEKITKWRELKVALEKIAGHKASLDIAVERGLLGDVKKDVRTSAGGNGEIVNFKVDVPAGTKTAEDVLASIGLEFPELYIASVEKGFPAEKGGLLKGDRITAINNQPVSNFDDVTKLIRSYDEKEQKPLAINVERAGQAVSLNVKPNMKERMSSQGREEKRFEIGISPMILNEQPTTVELTAKGPVEAVSRGVSQTLKWTSLTVLSFVRLFQAEVSPKNIGGFLSIGQMAKASWQIGPAQFLNIMAIISINLFILNLLPVPVLDGGHLVFYSIEALRGAPVSMKKMELAQQVGLVLLLGLMVFALFNDVTRLFN